jgi:hypothetical protein
VPWCPTCDRFLSPPTVTSEGTCPKCGRPVEPGRSRPRGASGPDDPPGAEEELPPVPRHLKVLGAAMVVYLGYRFLQGVEWVVHRF